MPLTSVNTQLSPNTLFACGTLLVYDYLCTFDQELAYVWTSPSKWTVGTLLFFLNRYLPFVDTFMALRLKLSVNTPEECRMQYHLLGWLIVGGIIISEAILLLRTYALWERKRSIFLILLVSSAITFTCAIVVTNSKSTHSIGTVVTSELPGCHAKTGSVIIIVAYVALAASETTMAVLTVIKAYRDLRHSQARWVIQLYRDGLLFYVYLLSVSLANILVPLFASRKLANWLATPQRVMHSVLTTRVLLLILKQRVRASGGMTNRAPYDARMESFTDSGMSTHMGIVGPGASFIEGGMTFAEVDDIDNESRKELGGSRHTGVAVTDLEFEGEWMDMEAFHRREWVDREGSIGIVHASKEV